MDEGAVTTADGRSLAYRTVGGNRPLVVFEAGAGSSGRVWGAVQREVGRHARAVAYDRGGYGTSSPDPAGRGLGRLAADLVEMLGHLDGGPAVVVAHSWGGPIVRRMAASRPDLVAAMVLVDPTDERCDLYFSGPMLAAQRRTGRMMPVLARLGLVGVGVRRLARGFPPDLLDELIASDTSVAAARMMGLEIADLEEDLRGLRDDPPVVPPIPITWISGTKRPRMAASVRTCLVDAHRASAAAHPGGRHVEAEASGHYVMWSQPELVVAEVLRALG